MTNILIADDEDSIRTILSHSLKKQGYQVFEAEDGEEAKEILSRENIQLGFVDIRMPRLTGLDLLNHQDEFKGNPFIIIMTAQDNMENTIEATKRGAYDYISKPFNLNEINDLTREVLSKWEETKPQTSPKIDQDFSSLNIIGKSKAIKEIYKTIGRIVDQNISVLIQGESGTGKELIAKVIHVQSNRKQSPFLAVNCSAIPENLLESELFGHTKGAFTGATQNKIGYFEKANQGTLFLDEIGDMPIDLQTKILRVLQENEIQKLGDTKSIPIDVRLISATNRNLEQLVKKGLFREDLFFRLNVVPISLPPLRERKSDIAILTKYFLEKFHHMYDVELKSITDDAMKYISSLDWPGNIRELENTLKRIVILNPEGTITKDHILEQSTSSKIEKTLSSSLEDIETLIYSALENYLSKFELTYEKDLYKKILPLIEKPLIEIVLKSTNSNQLKSSETLGINRNTLRKKIKDLKIKINDEKNET